MEKSNNTLAKVAIGINLVLIVAVIILFTKLPGSTVETTDNQEDTTKTTIKDDGELRIGYFNADSLSANLLIMKDLEAEMAKASTDAENKMKAKQREFDSWQAKWQNRGMLLPNEQEQYQMEAQQKQQEAMMFEQNIQMEVGQKQEMLMFSHIQRISNFAKIYAEENNYDYILSYQMGQNLFYASPNMNVTDGLVELMNEDYNATFSGNTDQPSDDAINNDQDAQ